MKHIFQIVAEESPVIHVESTDGNYTHSTRVTIGASNGNDVLASMTDADIQSHLQKALDDARSKNAAILNTKNRVQALASKLV